MTLIGRYQDVIEELFWVNNAFQVPGALSNTIEDTVRSKGRYADLAELRGGLRLYEDVGREILAKGSPYYIDSHVWERLAYTAARLPLDTKIHSSMWPTTSGYARAQDTKPPVHANVGLLWGYHTFGEPITIKGKDMPITFSGRCLFLIGLMGVYPAIGQTTAVPLGTMLWPESYTLAQIIEVYDQTVLVMGDTDAVEKQARLAAALALFMDQQLVTITRESADRATRHRLQRVAPNTYTAPDVLVVRLRRTHTASMEPRDTPLDHPYRWEVREHWRVLRRGTQDERRVKIGKYIKGPPGKPLKSAPMRVFTVVR